MKLEEAIKIYTRCLEDSLHCGECPLAEKKYFSDRSICSLLKDADLKAMKVK